MEKDKEEKANIADVIKSVLAAMFGVQSEQNRKRDFKQSNIVPYLVIGIISIGVLIFTLLGIVSIVTRE